MIRSRFCTRVYCRRLSTSSSTQLNYGPLKAYRKIVQEGMIREDKYQLEALEHLQRLYDEVIHYDRHVVSFHSSPSSSSQQSTSPPTLPIAHPETKTSSTSFFGRLFAGREEGHTKETPSNISSSSSLSLTSTPKSVYLWGGTGCGKTFIMDLFYDQLPIGRKRRVHFDSFMIDQEVHPPIASHMRV